MLYQIFDVLINSELPLPELASAEPSSFRKAVFGFSLAKGLLPSATNPNWIQRWFKDEEKVHLALGIARLNGNYLMHFPGLADFVVDVNRLQIRCHRATAIPDETVRHLFLDQLMPRVLGHLGNLVVHASAVDTEHGGMAFLGKSGWGKSTLASSFHRDGARLLSDDSLLLEAQNGRVVGYPAYAGSRLWRDSAHSVFPNRTDLLDVAHYSDKKRLILHDKKDNAIPTILSAIFLLNDPAAEAASQDVSIEPIRGSEAMMNLIKRAFLLDSGDMRTVAGQFSRASRIAEVDPAIYKLTYPREFALLEDLKACIYLTLVQKQVRIPHPAA